jgi:ribonuclease D
MTDTPLPAPVLIQDTASLASAVTALAAEPALAVDTESNSLFVYRERVCLIQFSTPRRDFILDPLRLPDLTALAPLFANPRQQKIFHAAEYDLICLKRDYGFAFANLFDTMVAARTLGWPQTGLATLLEKHFGVRLNKKHQRANWGRRPLTPEQLDYARTDTHYLFGLRDLLLAELAAAERAEEAQEEFERLARLKAEPELPDARPFWRVSGARDLTPRQASILREVYEYREQQAERSNLPPFKVMSDETLLQIARLAPEDKAALATVMGMTEGQLQRHAAPVLEAVQRGLAAPPLRPPKPVLEPEPVRERYEKLRRWRKAKALERGVESDVILPREALWEVARAAPRTLAEFDHCAHIGPWRRQAYGTELLKLLAHDDGNSTKDD